METNTDLAWLAGFIDGEGHIGVIRKIYRAAVRYEPVIEVTNTHVPTLDVTRKICADNGMENLYNASWKPPRPNQQPCWVIAARGCRRVSLWLDHILPYLRTRQARARYLREWTKFGLASPHPGPKGRPYSKREFEILSLFGVPDDLSKRKKRFRSLPPIDQMPIASNITRSPVLDAAWLAGFFDAEGTLSYQNRGASHPNANRAPVMSISHTHMPTLPAVRNILDANNLLYVCSPFMHWESWKEAGHSPQWQVRASGGRRVRAWLHYTMPYLKTKKKDAERMIEYITSIPAMNDVVDKEDIDIMLELWESGLYTQIEIGIMLGVSQSYVSMIVNKLRRNKK